MLFRVPPVHLLDAFRPSKVFADARWGVRGADR
jgi:hypothetical protein